MGFFNAFRKMISGQSQATGYQQADVYRKLRERIFSLTPQQLDLPSPIKPGGVWAVIMETGYPNAVASLIALADDTVSLYFSNGGGIIGAGLQAGPAQAARALLQAAPSFVHACTPTKQYPLPNQGEIRFYLHTHSGVVTAVTPETALKSNRHTLSPLFLAAHRLITEIRLVEQARQREASGK